MSIDDQMRTVADDIAAAAPLPPLEAVQARARRRRMRGLATATSTGVVLAGVVTVAVLAWPDSSPTQRNGITPVASSSPASPAGLDFTATVLPPGVAYASTEKGPANQFEEVIKRYRDSNGGQLLIIDVNRGYVMTPAHYGELLGYKLTKVDGHPAAVGPDDGRNSTGAVEAFVQISPTITIDVEDRGGLTLAQVLDVLRGVRIR